MPSALSELGAQQLGAQQADFGIEFAVFASLGCEGEGLGFRVWEFGFGSLRCVGVRLRGFRVEGLIRADSVQAVECRASSACFKRLQTPL